MNSEVIVFLLFFQSITCEFSDNIEVETNVGTIRGMKATDGDYNMYLGIPYGKVGDNPFGVSTPYPPFNETFEAYDDSTMCPQVNQVNKTITGTLDCLRLNIYVPSSTNSTKTVPVMVWLYGGAFEYGFGGRYLFGPTYLVQHNVIVVTLNYRTGPYGFMCLDTPEVSGNQGLKDQYLALKWIKQNIQAFGGAANQITLFGQSAGGHSIDLHLMSTKEILFNKIILQSGSAEALTVLYVPDKSAALKLSRFTGYETNKTRDALKHLSRQDPKSVIAAATNLKIQFKPCVEAQNDSIEPFISKSWINSPVPKVKNIPVLMGFNKLEYASIFFRQEQVFYRNSSVVKSFLERVFKYTAEVEETKDLLHHFYFGDNKINIHVKWPLIRFLSDITYIHPVHRTLKKYLKYEAENVYFYEFSYVGGRNIITTTCYDENDSFIHLCCASHNDELRYLFNLQDVANFTVVDCNVMERMTTMWTNFAKYSNPTPKTSQLLPIKWVPATKDTYYYLDIDADLTLGKRPLHARMAFWDLLYRHNEKFQRLYDD